jgi:hypothetical protein
MTLEVHKNNNASSEAALQKRRCCGTYFAELHVRDCPKSLGEACNVALRVA